MGDAPKPDPTCRSCAALSARPGEVEKLDAELTRLKDRKPKTSRTSSKPPSSDAPLSNGPASKEVSSGKKRGGQPAHKGKTRGPAAGEDVDQVKTVKPEHCSSDDDPDPLIHQIIDSPPVNPVIVGYQRHELGCIRCGKSTRADLPSNVYQSAFGPNLSALIALLSGEYRMSRRNIQRFIADSHGITISLGAIANIEGRMTKGLAEAHTEAMVSVAASPTKHLDETIWRESNRLCISQRKSTA